MEGAYGHEHYQFVNENYSMGANIVSLNEQQNKEAWKINS